MVTRKRRELRQSVPPSGDPEEVAFLDRPSSNENLAVCDGRSTSQLWHLSPEGAATPHLRYPVNKSHPSSNSIPPTPWRKQIVTKVQRRGLSPSRLDPFVLVSPRRSPLRRLHAGTGMVQLGVSSLTTSPSRAARRREEQQRRRHARSGGGLLPDSLFEVAAVI